MEILVDTVNLDEIKKYQQMLHLSGVTSNPTIFKKEGRVDFFDHLRKIREIIGTDETLHVQAVGDTTEEIEADAHRILQEIDHQVYIKIPTNEVGLKAMKALKKEGVHVTATAIYTVFQGELAMTVGADYLAPYYNRMLNMNIDAAQVINELALAIKLSHSKTKILAASFHNVAQVTDAFKNGAQAATIGTDVIASGLKAPMISAAVSDFKNDWQSLYGNQTIATLK
ncbi:fructose-6-phosphate aldolase [Ligilactobacillus pobuzihii]|uniref:Fructose-6-phosphate aldolase n=1 Tax=Ligilactobacillus pobuzihii TaxID=449659 RepID=A0A0R2LDG4_9LACO|nr:fructose-6-phosphate aldolase [Ligilactobacillus pobuzihii]KRK09292.1 fructose-6-phosphate aldolase [Ligilactobacillus pobuzihii E100301 = KCTC 13174]KRN99966.1 fructose-6-phosphate aldolase [Ligilactobacillus pobuzihii]GEN48757.1 transaldolase [Ligilactobacillus pobuzihii]